MKSNSGGKKSPTPKAVSVFKGIKGLLASGPGTKKAVNDGKIRPEGKVSIDAGNVKPASGTSKMAAGSPKNLSAGSGHKGIQVGTRPEPSVKRDAADVAKPF